MDEQLKALVEVQVSALEKALVSAMTDLKNVCKELSAAVKNLNDAQIRTEEQLKDIRQYVNKDTMDVYYAKQREIMDRIKTLERLEKERTENEKEKKRKDSNIWKHWWAVCLIIITIFFKEIANLIF